MRSYNDSVTGSPLAGTGARLRSREQGAGIGAGKGSSGRDVACLPAGGHRASNSQAGQAGDLR